MAQDRFDALDGMRGCLAMAVVAYHFNELLPDAAASRLRGGYLAVDFFFVLSGFVIAHGYAGRLASPAAATDFMVRRVARLYPAHLAMLVPYLLIELSRLASGQTNAGDALRAPFTGWASIPALMANLGLVQGFGWFAELTWNGPSWSIACEIWAYAVFAGLMLAPPRWRLPGLGLVAAAALGLLLALPTTSMNLSYDYGFIRCLAGFCLGALARGVAYPPLARRRLTVPLATGLELAALAGALAFVVSTAGDRRSLAAPVVFLVPLLVFARDGGAVSACLRSPPLALAGRLSFGIYMVHAVILYGVLTVAKKLTARAGWPLTAAGIGPDQAPVVLTPGSAGATLVLLTVVAAVVLIAAAGLRRWVEIPGQALILRLWAGWRRPHEAVVEARAGTPT